ncbi:MAG TPA: hypothetical protein VNO50_14230 [Pyrinomonadaceae bacterium]|nr:hypothetical protein [Pyrinomonadaceae bacterium]
MRNSKHGLKALVLAIMAALGMMAFGAISASAEEPKLHEHKLVLEAGTPLPLASAAGTFLYNLADPAVLVGEEKSTAITGKQLVAGYLLVAARDLKIECTELDVNEGVLNSTTDGKAKVLFLGCVANNHKGEPLANCEFKELKSVSASALVLPILHNGARYLLFEPLEGTQFANVSFKQNCILPLNNPVTGSVVAQVEGANLDATVQTIAFSEAIQLLSGDVLKYGALSNTSYVNGKAHLEGALGAKLGVH